VAIAGDRTCPILAIVALITWRSIRARRVKWVKLSLCVLAILGAGVLWKPIYVWAKSADKLSAGPSWSIRSLIAHWEPFVIHDNLEAIVGAQLSYDAYELLFDSAAQIVIAPSLVGADSGRFNQYMQGELFPDSRFGRAYSMLGQLWSVGGSTMVALGTCTIGFFATTLLCWSVRRRTLVAALTILVSLTLSMYVWRNSIENYLAIVRVMVLANGVPIGYLLCRVSR
jgi:hypothetical protein